MNSKPKSLASKKVLNSLLEKLKEFELTLNLSNGITAEDKKVLLDYFNDILKAI
jgi:hypothetical protein